MAMVTMGYTRESARRVQEGPAAAASASDNPGYLIYDCITLDQELVTKKENGSTSVRPESSLVGGRFGE